MTLAAYSAIDHSPLGGELGDPVAPVLEHQLDRLRLPRLARRGRHDVGRCLGPLHVDRADLDTPAAQPGRSAPDEVRAAVTARLGARPRAEHLLAYVGPVPVTQVTLEGRDGARDLLRGASRLVLMGVRATCHE